MDSSRIVCHKLIVQCGQSVELTLEFNHRISPIISQKKKKFWSQSGRSPTGKSGGVKRPRLPHFVEGILLFSKEAVVAVCRVKHALVGVVYEVKEIFLGVGMIEHGVGEFFVIKGDEVFFEVKRFRSWGDIFFVVVSKGFFFDWVEDFGG